MITETLTVDQAKTLGYEFYGYPEAGWIPMQDLNDFTESSETAFLFNKEPNEPFKTNTNRVKEILVDQLSSEWDAESGDDTGEMEDFLNSISEEKFLQITEILNDAMENKISYNLSNIKVLL